jgi:predicted nucleic acid-binding protein
VSAPGQARRGKAGLSVAVPATPVVLDSSCWLEYFVDTAQADHFAAAIEAVESLVVPVLTVYEVVKKLAREAGDETASAALGLTQRGRVVAIDLNLALAAAVNGLPLAYSLIYATARQQGAEWWTQDRHFEGLPGVKLFAKP